jgi:hypothetical protein
MKFKVLYILVFVFCACTVSKKEEDKFPQFFGEFLFYQEAAVLNTGSNIYGVKVDKKMHELNDLCKSFKKDIYDMIPVYIRGIVEDNPEEEGWEKLIRIVSIDSIVKPTGQSNLKL